MGEAAEGRVGRIGRAVSRPGRAVARVRGPALAGRVLGPGLPLLAAGCIFSTRTPHRSDGSEVPWEDPTSPEVVLTNLEVTFNAKSAGNYDQSLTDDFAFQPDPADLAFIGNPGYFENWTKQDEIGAFTAVFQHAEDSEVAFSWPPPVPDPGAVPGALDDSYFENLRYRMVFSRTGADTTISGKVDLYLRYSSRGWFIYKWVDKQDGSGNATLGLVRWAQRVDY